MGEGGRGREGEERREREWEERRDFLDEPVWKAREGQGRRRGHLIRLPTPQGWVSRGERRGRKEGGEEDSRKRENKIEPLVPNLDVDHGDVLERLVGLVAPDVLDGVDDVETGDGAAEDAVAERGKGNEVSGRKEGEPRMKKGRWGGDARVLVVEPGCWDGGDEKLSKTKEGRVSGKRRAETRGRGGTNLRAVRLGSSCEAVAHRSVSEKGGVHEGRRRTDRSPY